MDISRAHCAENRLYLPFDGPGGVLVEFSHGNEFEVEMMLVTRVVSLQVSVKDIAAEDAAAELATGVVLVTILHPVVLLKGVVVGDNVITSVQLSEDRIVVFETG